MTASVTHTNHPGDRYQKARAELAEQNNRFTLKLLARPLERAATAVWQALMRLAVAYERTAQERIMRELALSHPNLVAQIRAARAIAAAEAAH